MKKKVYNKYKMLKILKMKRVKINVNWLYKIN